MNRPDELRRALSSVFEGTVAPDEVIVSDDGDGGAEAVAAEFPGVIYQVGPRRGLGANRNACVERSTSGLVAFIDDDVTVSPEFVARAKGLLGDSIVTGWELNHLQSPPRKVTPHNANYLGFQVLDPQGNYSSIVINSTVIPREVAISSGFDELTKYGYEEIDFARHARSEGWKIVYDDELWVSHFPSEVNRSSYQSGINVSRLYLTRWAYGIYENKPLKGWIYSVVAGLHHVISATRSGAAPTAAVSTALKAAEFYRVAKRTRR